MASKFIKGENQPLSVTVATAKGVEVGDIVGMSSGTLVKASDTTWNTDLATTQAAFVLLFAGVSTQRKIAGTARIQGNSDDNQINIAPQGVVEFDCASASFAFGDLVGPAKQTGNALEDQKVAAAGSESVAIGRVAKATTSATKVWVQILPKLMPAARQS